MTDPRGHSRKPVRRRHHKVEALPPSLYDQVADRLRRGESYQAVEAWLAGQGHPIGASSLHRWHRFLTEGLDRIRERAMLAQRIADGVAGHDPTVVQSAAYQIAMQQALEMLIALEAGETEMAPAALAKLMTALARMGGTSTQLSRYIDEQRQRRAEADREVDDLADRGQLSAEQADRVKRIYGIEA